MTRKALIVSGGGPLHQPQEIAGILAELLRQENFEVEVSNTWDVFDQREKIMKMNLIVPNWGEASATPQQLNNLFDAVSSGTGLAGLHAGMGYTFPGNSRYHLMVGGLFAAHPGNHFRVLIRDPNNSITRGIPDFDVTTEHYYMLTDPSIEVLATSYYETYPPEVWSPVFMPVVWIKKYGKGRVFYNALGHTPEIVLMPEVLTLMRRGMKWAAR